MVTLKQKFVLRFIGTQTSYWSYIFPFNSVEKIVNQFYKPTKLLRRDLHILNFSLSGLSIHMIKLAFEIYYWKSKVKHKMSIDRDPKTRFDYVTRLNSFDSQRNKASYFHLQSKSANHSASRKLNVFLILLIIILIFQVIAVWTGFFRQRLYLKIVYTSLFCSFYCKDWNNHRVFYYVILF